MMSKAVAEAFWACMDRRDWEGLSHYFVPSAMVYWPNTNEKFSVRDYVLVNSRYPGTWRIALERMEQGEKAVITVVKVSAEGGASFHATSFFEFSEGSEQIAALWEYWGDDDAPPAWRPKWNLGTPIEP